MISREIIGVSLRRLLQGGIASLACVAFADPPSAMQMEQTVSATATYVVGQSVEPFRTIERWVGDSVSNPGLRVQVEAGLIKLLGTNATFGARRFACKQLGV